MTGVPAGKRHSWNSYITDIESTVCVRDHAPLASANPSPQQVPDIPNMESVYLKSLACRRAVLSDELDPSNNS